ncbi:hypothetical protein BDC45DRAFT_540194 [Circinella umbellata]|nr:hypothetical protein BDC45DRAFT_540194 [Circinella umbellata]
MTRYTTMGKKKQHVKADESFKVTPLKAGKPTEEKTDNNNKNDDHKRKRPAKQNFNKEDNQRKKRRHLAKERSTVCFGCRQKGHSVGSCPQANVENQEKRVCYPLPNVLYAKKKVIYQVNVQKMTRDYILMVVDVDSVVK